MLIMEVLMSIAGSAVGSALTKLKVTLEGDAQAEIVSEKEAEARELKEHRHDKSLTHHYKATHTHTHTYEVDDSVDEAKLSADDTKTEKTKKKRRGCFGFCMGKKE